MVATVVPTHLAAAVPEVAVYLKEAVGNSTRIDYGTGICCCRALGDSGLACCFLYVAWAAFFMLPTPCVPPIHSADQQSVCVCGGEGVALCSIFFQQVALLPQAWHLLKVGFSSLVVCKAGF